MTQTTLDPMPPWPAQALHIALDRAGPPPAAEDPLPPFAHQVYFLEATRPDGLGRDGHPARGGFLPDMGLPRRMWAGGRLKWHAPLVLGTPAERRSAVETTTHKQGRSGPLGFVTVRHEVHQASVHCLTEWQDLVYREDPSEDAPARPAPAAPQGEKLRDLTYDSTLLFRYSALSFNGHRIHYDLPYAQTVEGYADLVVHGPLLAQLMMLAAHDMAPLTGFSYRAAFPVTLGTKAALFRDGARFWVASDAGLHMSGEAVWT